MSGKGEKKIWKVIARWIVASLSVLAAAVSAFLVWAGVPQAERQAWPVYQRVVAGGTPLDQAAFEASFAAKPEENAASELMPVLEAVRRKWSALPVSARDALDGRNRFTDDPEVTEAFKLIQPEFEAVRAATVKPRFVPDRDWSDPSSTLFPEYADIRRVVRLAGIRALYHARRGETDEAVKLLEFSGVLASYASDTPTLIGYLVESTSRAIQADAAHRCAAVDPRNAGLYASPLREQQVRPFGRALRGEAFISVGMGRYLTNRDLLGVTIERSREWLNANGVNMGEPTGPEYLTNTVPAPQEGLPSSVFARASIAKVLLKLEPTLALLNPDGSEKTPGSLGPALVRLGEEVQRDTSIANSVAQVLIPIFSQAHSAGTMIFARYRLTHSWAKILEFRERNGRWPADLEEAGASQFDPFAPGSEMGYRLDGKGFRVWSVGQDRVDQGGKTRRESNSSSAFDEVLIYPVPDGSR